MATKKKTQTLNYEDYSPEKDTPALTRVVHMLYIHCHEPSYLGALQFLQSAVDEEPGLLHKAIQEAATLAGATETRQKQSIAKD